MVCWPYCPSIPHADRENVDLVNNQTFIDSFWLFHYFLAISLSSRLPHVRRFGKTTVFYLHPFEDWFLRRSFDSTRILCDPRVVCVWLIFFFFLHDDCKCDLGACRAFFHRMTHSICGLHSDHSYFNAFTRAFQAKRFYFILCCIRILFHFICGLHIQLTFYLLLFVYINHCCCLCLACPVFREIHCLFPRKLMAHWVRGDDTPMMSWCHAQTRLTDTWYDKLLRQTYTDATSSGMTRGHECDVAGRPNNGRVRTLFVDYIRLSPTKQNASLYFVLHSYFIPTRLQSKTLLLNFVLHSYFIPTLFADYIRNILILKACVLHS